MKAPLASATALPASCAPASGIIATSFRGQRFDAASNRGSATVKVSAFTGATLHGKCIALDLLHQAFGSEVGGDSNRANRT